jgi:dolichol kinase
MTVVLPVVLALASVAVLLGLMAGVRRLAQGRGWPPEVQRKIVHIGTGLFALLLPVLFADDWPVYLLLGLTLVVMLALRSGRFSQGIGATLHAVERRSYGDFFLALAVGLVFLLSGREPLFYVLPLAVLTLSDAAAALAGTAYGRRFFEVEGGRKSLEGSAVFFMVTLIVAMVCLLLLSEIPRANVVLIAVMVAAFGTLVEADSWRGFDNLFLPLGILIFLMVHYHRAPGELLALMALFSAALVLLYGAAPGLGLSFHMVRVYVVAAFLLLSVTAVQNTVLPLLFLMLHAGLQARLPAAGAGHRPVHDAVAVVALVSFGWLALGQAFGANALDYFAMTCMGLCAGLVMLTLPLHAPWRALVAVLAGAVLYALWSGLTALNPETARWTGGIAVWGVVSLGVAAVPPYVWPGRFADLGMARLAGLAAAVPVLVYAGMQVIGEQP